jgi:hypothetical protein
VGKKWKYLLFLLYKCHNFRTKKFVYSIWQTTNFHYSAKVSRLSTIRRKSKTLSYLDFVLCSMNRTRVSADFHVLIFLNTWRKLLIAFGLPCKNWKLWPHSDANETSFLMLRAIHRNLSTGMSMFAQGSMLWSQFSAIFAIFLRKKLAFFSKTNVMIKFLHNLALFWAKNAKFFAKKFRRKYFQNHNIGPRSSKHFWRKKTL